MMNGKEKMNKTDKRVCPEFRPLMAQANAGEGPFRMGEGIADVRDRLPHFTPYSTAEFTPTADQGRWYQLRHPQGQWKRADPPAHEPDVVEVPPPEQWGFKPAPDPAPDEPPIDPDMFEPAATFEALLDRFERMCQLQEARTIKNAPHPTRERLLDAVRWALGEDDHHNDIKSSSFSSNIDMFRARLRRLAGL